jgi:hypothetical protein
MKQGKIQTMALRYHLSLVGAAEGCDLLICVFNGKIKRSQPAAAPA